MSWLQISITTDRGDASAIEDTLLEQGALSVTLKDAADEPILEPDIGTTPIWQHAIVTGLFERPDDEASLLQRIRTALPENSQLSTEQLDDQNWTRAWMDDYQAMQFGERLWVCPWHIDPPDDSAVNLRLDPGLAFGTGTHPTTSLCLSWLDKNINTQQTLLDYGCGSGILAIAALLLGAEHADCVDIDEQAIIATNDNARANHVETRINALSVEQFRKTAEKQYDIVVANILSGPLVELAPTLQAHVAPGGEIVLSGILQEQAEQTRQAYQAFFEMSDIVSEEDWVLLHGRKPA